MPLLHLSNHGSYKKTEILIRLDAKDKTFDFYLMEGDLKANVTILMVFKLCPKVCRFYELLSSILPSTEIDTIEY